jgi:hypothetical protein
METEDGRMEIFARVVSEDLRTAETVAGLDLVVEAAPPVCGFDISVV